jgi:hypothetical protein
MISKRPCQGRHERDQLRRKRDRRKRDQGVQGIRHGRGRGTEREGEREREGRRERERGEAERERDRERGIEGQRGRCRDQEACVAMSANMATSYGPKNEIQSEKKNRAPCA